MRVFDVPEDIQEGEFIIAKNRSISNKETARSIPSSRQSSRNQTPAPSAPPSEPPSPRLRGNSMQEAMNTSAGSTTDDASSRIFYNSATFSFVSRCTFARVVRSIGVILYDPILKRVLLTRNINTPAFIPFKAGLLSLLRGEIHGGVAVDQLMSFSDDELSLLTEINMDNLKTIYSAKGCYDPSWEPRLGDPGVKAAINEIQTRSRTILQARQSAVVNMRWRVPSGEVKFNITYSRYESECYFNDVTVWRRRWRLHHASCTCLLVCTCHQIASWIS